MKSHGPGAARLLAIAGAAFLSFAATPMAWAQERYSAYVMDARTGEVLHSDMADDQRYPASLTKMMTLYLLFDALERGDISLESQITASRHAASMAPSRLGLRRGSRITVDQAIRAICVQSANDVAVAIAERLGGSENRFAQRMTERARALGMTNTHFANASGLPDPDQRSTAHDMAILSQALWRDFPEYYHYFQTPSFAWGRHYGRSHNRLIGSLDGVDGIKTGYTQASGYNLASSAERGGRRVIVVVMGGETATARDAQVAYLIEGAFEQFARRQQLQPGQATFVTLPTTRVDSALGPNGTVTTTSQVFGPNGAPVTTSQGDQSTDDAAREVGSTGAQ